MIGLLFFALVALGILIKRSPLHFFKQIVFDIGCLAQNKQPGAYGFSSIPVCLSVYSDGGQPCSFSTECKSGLCVKTQRNPKAYCRKYDQKLPLCASGEATIEDISNPKTYMSPYIFCD